MRTIVLIALSALCLDAQEWVQMFSGKNLDGWEVVGDGVWNVMKNGIVVGDRIPGKSVHQSWLYSKKEYTDFDLRMEYWTRIGGNSGISIRDKTRAKFAVGSAHDGERTPSHNGYEIQIMNSDSPDPYPTGSIYLFKSATNVKQNLSDWNELEIRSRKDSIKVTLNGVLVCEHPGDPKRPRTGPIGLQLHDEKSAVMFRGVRIRER